jgi:hypothetical protein
MKSLIHLCVKTLYANHYDISEYENNTYSNIKEEIWKVYQDREIAYIKYVMFSYYISIFGQYHTKNNVYEMDIVFDPDIDSAGSRYRHLFEYEEGCKARYLVSIQDIDTRQKITKITLTSKKYNKTIVTIYNYWDCPYPIADIHCLSEYTFNKYSLEYIPENKKNEEVHEVIENIKNKQFIFYP